MPGADEDDDSLGSLFGHVDLDFSKAEVGFPMIADSQDLQEDYAGEFEPKLNETADVVKESIDEVMTPRGRSANRRRQFREEDTRSSAENTDKDEPEQQRRKSRHGRTRLVKKTREGRI